MNRMLTFFTDNDHNVMCMRSGLVIRTIPSVRGSRNSENSKNHNTASHQYNEGTDCKPKPSKYKSRDYLSIVTRYQMMHDSIVGPSEYEFLNTTFAVDAASQETISSRK